MHAILSWVKQFLTAYLILTILMNLAAADQYKKYLRFLSGVILLLLLISPVLRLTGRDGRLQELISYETLKEQLGSIQQDTQKLEFLQNEHDIKKYQDAIADDIVRQAAAQQLPLRKADVTLNGDYEINKVTVFLDAAQVQDIQTAREKLLDYLKGAYGLEECQIFIS